MNFYERYFKKEDFDKPYHHSLEQLQDLFGFLDVLLHMVFILKIGSGEHGEKLLLKGISVKDEDIITALNSYDMVSRNISIPYELEQELELIKNHIYNRTSLSESAVFLRFRFIAEKFGLSDCEIICMLMALAIKYDKKYEKIYGAIEENANLKMLTKGIVLAVIEVLGLSVTETMKVLLKEDSPMYKYILNRPYDREDTKEVLSQQISIRNRIAGYLLEDEQIDAELNPICTLFEVGEECVELDIHHEIFEKLCSIIEYSNYNQGCTAINLVGPKGIGKSTIVKNMSEELDVSVLFIDISKLVFDTLEKIYEKLDAIIAEVIITDSIPCFEYYIETEQSQHNLTECLKYIENSLSFFILFSYSKIREFQDTSIQRIVFEIPMLSAKEKEILWNRFSQGYKIGKDVDLKQNASRYIHVLTAKAIKEVLETAWLICYSENRDEILQKDIVLAVNQQNFNQLGEMATRINAVFTWENLVVDEDQKKQMMFICNQLKYRTVIGEEWGFHKIMPYGKGISVLFYGAPGTGKTMAAQVMANELGMDLYRIDISQMVSKYIGETEKNISKLFEKAKHINALLFFDEADSLFAKRSEVKDSHDRNANAETAHLLQKLEEYDGISILATNYANNIDEAFKRRIRFMINFSFPSAEIRYKLWTTMLPKEAKVKDNVDFEFFANQFELSGSNIKEILINAAYMAVSEGKSISNKYIIEAIKNNFYKQGRILLNSDFGEYGES